MRRLILAATAVAGVAVTALFMAGPALASASAPPPEGIFETCPLGTSMSTCVQRLEIIRAGGFQVVVIPANGASPSALAEYAGAAHAIGLSVMWELSDPSWWRQPLSGGTMAQSYPAVAAACGCSTNGAVLAYFVRWLSQLPATYGYYAADDSMLGPGDQAGVAAYVAAIKAQDPSHMVMIGSADQSQTDTYQAIADTIGTEIYPVTTSSLMPVSKNQGMWGDVGYTATEAQHSASADGKSSAFILQAFTWGDNLSDGESIGDCTPLMKPAACYAKNQYPSAAAQLALRNEVLAHSNPSLILWWSFPGTYGQAGSDTYSIYPTGATAHKRWSGLVSAVRAPWPPPATHARRRVSAHAASVRKQRSRRHSRHRRG